MIKSLALVDASHRFSVNFHAQADSGGPNGCVDVTINELEAMRDYAQHVVICVDRGPYWRHEVFPEYKAGRERRAEYPALYSDFMNKLELSGFAVVGSQGYEADDIMATLARSYYDQCDDIRLVTDDKDALQLLNDHVRVHCWRGRGEFEVRDVEWLKSYAKMGAAPKSSKAEAQPAVTPEQVPLLQAIMGDKGDNIKGVDGIGPVQGGAFVRKFWTGEPLRTIAAITEYCQTASMAAKVPALITKWLAGCGQVGLWVKLTTLRNDVPLDLTDLLEHKPRHPAVVEVDESGSPLYTGDPVLDGIFEDILEDGEPSAEDLAAEAAEMAGTRPAEDLISAPPAKESSEFREWVDFKGLLNAKQAVDLAGLAHGCEYAKELVAKFRENLTRNEQSGTPYTPQKAAAAAYAVVKTPAEKRLIGATPDHNTQKAADRKAMSNLADVVLPLPKEKTPAGTQPAATAGVATPGRADPKAPAVCADPKGTSDVPKPSPYAAPETWTQAQRDVYLNEMFPKAPSVDASTKPAAGVSTATAKAPDQPEPTSAQAATPVAGAAPRSEVVPNSQGPRAPLPGQRVEKSIDESALGIVAYPAPSWALSCEPASAGHTITISTRLWGKTQFLKDKFSSPEAMALTILHGRNLGQGLAISLMEIHVIRGRPSCSSRLISALAQQDPNHEYTQMVQLTDTYAKVLIKDRRIAEPTPWDYSIAEAEALGLTKPSPKSGEKSQWVIRPKVMLLKTATAIGHRFMFPGKVLGLHPIELEPEGQQLVTE